MKFAYRFAFVLFIAISVVACSKKDKTTPAFVIEGQWTGKLGDGSLPPTGSLKWNIKSNGVIERINASGVVSATGTWTLVGNEFNASYTFPNSGGTATFNGSVDKMNNKVSGEWGNTGGETGTFYVTKTVQ